MYFSYDLFWKSKLSLSISRHLLSALKLAPTTLVVVVTARMTVTAEWGALSGEKLRLRETSHLLRGEQPGSCGAEITDPQKYLLNK